MIQFTNLQIGFVCQNGNKKEIMEEILERIREVGEANDFPFICSFDNLLLEEKSETNIA